jgi:hypothetical protein
MTTFTLTEDTQSSLIEANELRSTPGDEDLFFDRLGTPAHGTVTMLGPGFLFYYTPDPDFSGDDSVQVWFSEDARRGEEQYAATLDFVVTPENDAPTAGDDGPLPALPGQPQALGVALLSNDGDVDGEPVEIVDVRTDQPEAFSKLAVDTWDGVRVTVVPDVVGPAGFTYTIADPSGVTADATVVLDATASTPATDDTVLAYNIGSNTAFTAADGTVFAADDLGVGRRFDQEKSIAGTEKDPLYRTEAFAAPGEDLDYDFEVDSGKYEITLYFAEIWDKAYTPGTRIFDVLIEEQTVVADLDIAARVGGQTAIEITHTVEVTDGVLDVDLMSDVQNAKLSAIKVEEATLPTAPLTLFDAANDRPLFELGPSVVIDASSIAGADLSASVTPVDDGPVASAVLHVEGEPTAVEAGERPWTLFGDAGGDVAGGLELVDGDVIEIGAELFAAEDASGAAVQTATSTIRVQEGRLDAGTPGVADIFALDELRSGPTTIADFDEIDQLALFGDRFADAEEVLDRTTVVGEDTLVDFGFGNTVTLEDFTSLSADDLLL